MRRATYRTHLGAGLVLAAAGVAFLVEPWLADRQTHARPSPKASPPPWAPATPGRMDTGELTTIDLVDSPDPVLPCALFLVGVSWMAWAGLRSRGPSPSGTSRD